MKSIKIAPSILSADFSELGKQLKILECAGIEMIHIDIMDGNFVPNITIGAPVVKTLRAKTKLVFDTHLMIQHPEKFISDFADAGSDIITVHIEAKGDIGGALRNIKDRNLKAGIALNPTTSLSKIKRYIDDVDMLVIMTVNPGFAGQKFMPEVIPKIKEAREIIDKKQLDTEIEVDGGINLETAPLAVKAGANVLAAGSCIFTGNINENITKLKEAVEEKG